MRADIADPAIRAGGCGNGLVACSGELAVKLVEQAVYSLAMDEDNGITGDGSESEHCTACTIKATA